MSFLAPLGLLGLLGVLALIVIYIIKPNYQNKHISSTYIWRLSMRYKKERLPISKIQNLLTFLCQVCILALLGTMLAGPVIANRTGGDVNETVLVVDASAGMRIAEEGKTRFSRAVELAREKAVDSFAKGSPVSLILADESPEFLFTRVSTSGMADAISQMDALYSGTEEYCSFTSADTEGALALAESVLTYNPAASVYFYTGTEYVRHSGVKTVNVSSETEWNAAVLDCRAETDSDNHYRITVDVGCYGKTDFLTVSCKVHGVNGDPSSTVLLEKGEFFDPSAEEKSILFTSDDITSGAIYSYDYIEAYVGVRDSLADDNAFFLYGGNRPVIRVQYVSSSPNNFFESAVRSLRQDKREVWDIQYTSLKADEPYATEGFDLYIFEHRMPEKLPTDGVVLLVDPTSAPIGSGLQIGASYKVDKNSVLSAGASHALTKYTDPRRITVAKYNDILLAEDYEELMFFNGRPVMLLKDTEEAKVAVWAFDLNYSNIIALPDFSTLMYNLFNHFIPETFTGNAFFVGDTVDFHGRGTDLTVRGNGEEYHFSDGTGSLSLTRPGTYTVTQNTVGGGELPEERFFVRIPPAESNTAKTADTLPAVEGGAAPKTVYEDILFYFAVALTVLMAAEWFLEIKKNY